MPSPGLQGGGRCADRGSGSWDQRVRGRARRRQRPAQSHRRTDLGPYLLGQLPPPHPSPRRRPGPRLRLRRGRPGAPLPRGRPPPGSARAAAGCCPAEQRGARPPGEEPEVINNSWEGGHHRSEALPAAACPPQADQTGASHPGRLSQIWEGDEGPL